MNETKLLEQLHQLHGAGFDYVFGSRRNPNFETMGYFAFDPLDEEEYLKERKKDWKRLGIKKPFKKWVVEDENEDYIYILEEINNLEFDMTEILDFIDYGYLLMDDSIDPACE